MKITLTEIYSDKGFLNFVVLSYKLMIKEKGKNLKTFFCYFMVLLCDKFKSLLGLVKTSYLELMHRSERIMKSSTAFVEFI